MADELYDRLADIFNLIGYGSRRSPELEALLKALFTEEEARLAVNLSPMMPEAPGKLAGRLGLDAGHVAHMLDNMADKGLIYSSTRNGEKWYKLIQLVPGIFELQFMKGEVTERGKELARLFDAYFHARMPQEKADARPGEGKRFGSSCSWCFTACCTSAWRRADRYRRGRGSRWRHRADCRDMSA